ncbi:MAG: hypothetical protein ABIN05_02515 [candidate division WOR-3 bacterium]
MNFYRRTQKEIQTFGIDKKSEKIIFGLPLYHISFGIDENKKIRKARGFFALGQYASGYIVIAQFGYAYIFGLGQFIIASLSIAQFSLGLFSIGQFSIGIFSVGQIALGLYTVGLSVYGKYIYSTNREDKEIIEFFTRILNFLKILIKF